MGPVAFMESFFLILPTEINWVTCRCGEFVRARRFSAIPECCNKLVHCTIEPYLQWIGIISAWTFILRFPSLCMNLESSNNYE